MKTKRGFDIHCKVVGGNNPTNMTPDATWVQYQINATIHNPWASDAGYIKMGWVPKDVWKNKYPTLWHFARLSGWCIGQEIRDLPTDVNEWTPAQKAAIVNSADGYMNFRYTHGYENMTPDKVLAIWDDVNLTLKKMLEAKYKRFEASNVDRPIVDFINAVYTRQHIALALYQNAAKWLYDRFGLYLHPSDTQQPEAEAAWLKMEKLGWVVNSAKHSGKKDIGKHLCPKRSQIFLDI